MTQSPLRVEQCVSQALYQTLQTIKINFEKTARLTSKLKNHDCNPCFNSFQVCPSVSPFVFVLYLFFVLIISAVIFIYQSLCGSSRCLFDKFASCPRAYEI